MIIRGAKVDVYVEVTYLSDYLIILVSLEMMGILLSKEMHYLQVLKNSFFLSMNIFFLYVDKCGGMVFIGWLVIFYLLYRRQIFLYYPVFIFIYFSILVFISSLCQEGFIYNVLLMVPLEFGYGILFVIGILVALIQVMFIVYIKRKVRINDYLYPIELEYQGTKYLFKGFLDSGNEVYFEGFPLILIKKGIINDYEVIDVMKLNDLRTDVIEIIVVDKIIVNGQVLKDVYVGIISGICYECLLNKVLMGGVL